MAFTKVKYIDSDYDPIPCTDHIWLPKDFNDKKYLTAYVRRSTRLGICLYKSNDLSIEDIYKGHIKPNLDKCLNLKEFKGKTKHNLVKVMGSITKTEQVPYVDAGTAFANKLVIKSRKKTFKLNHYARLYQQKLVDIEYKGVFPKFTPKDF